MATADDPAIPRRRLKAELRAAREEKGLTREDAAKSLEVSLSKLVRIETGDQGVSVADLRAMLQLYGVADEDRVSNLTELARGSRRQSLWSGYRDIISKQFTQLLGYEAAASHIRTFHPLILPALLHTDSYGLALLQARRPAEAADRLVRLRMERQARTFDAPAPDMEFIVGEEALTRAIGGAAIMRRQLRRLLEIMDETDASIRVVPFSKGAHPGLLGSFILLSLPDPGGDVLFMEEASGDFVVRDDQKMITDFSGYFDTLREMALSESETRSLIRQRIDQYGDHDRVSL